MFIFCGCFINLQSYKEEKEMKSWCDLSWREKCKIEDGDADGYKYLTGYTFQVKTKVQKGKESKKRRKKDE